MTGDNGKSRVPESWRMSLRVVAVFLAYLAYRIPGDDRLPAGVSLGVGVLLFLFVMIDRWTLPRRERFGMMQVATTILAMGLMAAGLLLAVR